MAAFNVIEIINGNTVKVSPGWRWGNLEGDLVQIAGYKNLPQYNSFAANKLKTLLQNTKVDLKNPTGTIGEGIYKTILCYVYLNEIDISLYFPELKNV